ncbi:MAG: hypothetical protein JWO86_9175 [Myxococcaceae bacterium]|nr:hypothetical protein [Myxococcaceae bacterium]
MIKSSVRWVALGMIVTACGGSVALGGPKDGGPGSGPGSDGSGGSGGSAPSDGIEGVGTVPTGTQKVASKVDLLLVIDDSRGTLDKQQLLRSSLPDLLTRLVSPRCIDSAGQVVGSSANGACASGRPEFAPVTDLHVGFVSSSLGSGGGDICPASSQDTHAHLLQQGADGHVLPDAAAGFLAFGPGAITDPNVLRADLTELISGVGEAGCGFEAPLESWYRFLVQPQPYASITVDTTNRAVLHDVDATILKQRHDFLRPDSLLAVLMLGDEEDASTDSLEVGGEGWAFTSRQFPGSPNFRADGTSTTAPRAASHCTSDPAAVDCTSCGFAATCAYDDPACQALKNDPNCQGTGGYYAAAEDELNVRFHHMKQRYGLDPQFPITRYVNGLSSGKVPSRNGEHAPLASPPTNPGSPPLPTLHLPYPRSYLGINDCDNPIFSASLPSTPGDELCHLPVGPRSRDLVIFGVITGVPSQLLPSAVLGEQDWKRILGKDPVHFDFTGIDPHMIQSVTPRVGLPGPTAANDADPLHGRERDTAGADLQYACTYALAVPIDCPGTTYCECTPTSSICGTGASASQQVRGTAYPGIRQLEVARALGTRAIVSSACPIHATEAAPGDPLFAYRSAMSKLGDRMAQSLAPQ